MSSTIHIVDAGKWWLAPAVLIAPFDEWVLRRFISYASTTRVVEVGDGSLTLPHSKVGKGDLMSPLPKDLGCH